ncbi:MULTISPECIES: hypothetical protein [Bacillus]|nr:MULTISPECIES: hypothetical protein [Bacillus]
MMNSILTVFHLLSIVVSPFVNDIILNGTSITIIGKIADISIGETSDD